jgi:hypothetical protein
MGHAERVVPLTKGTGHGCFNRQAKGWSGKEIVELDRTVRNRSLKW